MRRPRFLRVPNPALTVVLALSVFGCAAGDERFEEQPNPTDGTEVVIGAETDHLRGILVIGHEMRSFRPCGSDREYWLRTEGTTLDELRTAIDSLTTEPYQPVGVELVGHLSYEVGDGFAADFDGTVFIDAVEWIGPASEVCHGVSEVESSNRPERAKEPF